MITIGKIYVGLSIPGTTLNTSHDLTHQPSQQPYDLSIITIIIIILQMGKLRDQEVRGQNLEVLFEGMKSRAMCYTASHIGQCKYQVLKTGK